MLPHALKQQTSMKQGFAYDRGRVLSHYIHVPHIPNTTVSKSFIFPHIVWVKEELIVVFKKIV